MKRKEPPLWEKGAKPSESYCIPSNKPRSGGWEIAIDDVERGRAYENRGRGERDAVERTKIYRG